MKLARLKLTVLSAAALLGVLFAPTIPKACAADPPVPPPVDSPNAPPATDPAAATQPGGSTHGAVTEIKPAVFYLRDKDNQLVPVPGFSFDDFVRYYRLKEKLEKPDSAPRYSLEQMTISGEPHGDRAELTVVFKVLTTSANWVRVPLRLNKCALREPAAYEGKGEQFLQSDPAGDGFVSWIRGPEHSEHQLTMKLLAPLASGDGDGGGDGRLELALPRAAAAKLSLHVPVADALATVSAGLAPPDVAPAGSGGGSEISVLGVGGDCWLAWRKPDQSAQRPSAALEATGAIFVKIDGRSVNSEATLTVRSFGAEFDRFHVQLPAGSQLVGTRQEGYTLSPAGKDPAAGLVEVRLDHKTAGPVEARLAAERAFDVTKADEPIELAGFAVSEAIAHRQSGFIGVSVAGDWQLTWGRQTRVRQISELPEPFARKGLAASFEYVGQPSSLQARVAPRRTRLSVEPQYTYTVRSDETELEATLNYTIHGSKLFELQIEMPGWELDRVRPENLIDADGIATSPEGVVTLPLVQPTSGELTVAFTARRPRAAAEKSIEWTLPQPRADAVGPAEVAILSAGNIELIPRREQFVGLSQVALGGPSAAGPEPADPREQPLYFRGEHAGAKFVADLAIRPREVIVAIDQQVAVRAGECAVSETLDYQVRFEPLEQLSLDFARELWDGTKPAFVVGRETITPTLLSAPSAPAGRVRVLLPLRRPALGPLRLEVSYSVPHEGLSAAGGIVAAIPLISPRDGRVVSDAATVSPLPGIHVEARGGAWSVAAAPAGRTAADLPLRLSASTAPDSLPLAFTQAPERSASATFIDRAWVQTWLTETARQDRVDYLLTSSEDALRVSLPAGIAPGDVELSLDGQPLAAVGGPAGILIVPLPPDAARREHLLELRYLFERRGPHNGRLELQAPRLENHVRIRRTYWQLVLPADENLVAASGDLTPEYDWAWRGDFLGFHRVPLKDERQLEQWIGIGGVAGPAEIAPAHPAEMRRPADDWPARANCYLFSTSGSRANFEVEVARRWLVLLVASGAALAIGLAMIYRPALRRPVVLAAVAGLLLVGGLIYPDLFLLAVQPACLGLALVALALLLRTPVGRRRRAALILPPAPGSARLERGSSAPPRYYPIEKPPSAAAAASVAATTASIAVESPSHESAR